MTDVYNVISVVVTFLIGLIAGGAVTRMYYKKFKDAVHAVRECIDAVDDALADDKVERSEVQRIVENCKKIVNELLK